MCKTSTPSLSSAVRKGLPWLINSISRRLSINSASVIGLDLKALLNKAFKQTGLDDLGDGSSLDALAALLQSIESDARLNLTGRLCFRGDILRMLCNRLYLQEDRRRNPFIAKQVINRPLFITGLPRTGSTLLHALLARDPASRAPQVWEVMYPSPPPQARSHASDRRIGKTAADLKWLDVIMPGFKTAHMIGPRFPQECIAITAHSFISYLFESMYFVDSYRAWHDGQDKTASYEYHRRFLQHLQALAPGTHWVLKAPSHLFSLEELLKVYPDARIVFTHRDPLEVLPSCASFTAVLRGAFTDHIDKENLGIEISRHWQKGASLAVEFSKGDQTSHERPLDILYEDLVRNPMGVVRLIYNHFGMKFTNEAETAMFRFLSENPQNINGVHRYALGEFGLDRDAERDRFAFYTDFFGIEPVS